MVKKGKLGLKKKKKKRKEKKNCLIRLPGHRGSVLLRSKITLSPFGGIKVLHEMTTFSSKRMLISIYLIFRLID